MKKVKGFFVIVIKQFDTTMFDADYHYTPWCIAFDKYCRFDNIEKMMKFDTYVDAEQYAKDVEVDTTHDRILEIAYLTTTNADDDADNDSLLCNWLQVKAEEDALDYDIRQKQGRHLDQVQGEDVPGWDSTKFSSLYKTSEAQLEP